jgi:hypothetical protein
MKIRNEVEFYPVSREQVMTSEQKDQEIFVSQA